MKVLGIESSCDETGVALYERGAGLLANKLFSQVDMHARYGGVVPELASRDHVRKLAPLIREALQEAGLTLDQVDAVAYTSGPGLAGALLVGASLGRSLAWALSVPAIGVHHLEGHLLAPMLQPFHQVRLRHLSNIHLRIRGLRHFWPIGQKPGRISGNRSLTII